MPASPLTTRTAAPRPSPAPAPNGLAYLSKLAEKTRRLAIVGIYHAGSGHPGGSLSCADVLACLYGAELHIPTDIASYPQRDRFVLSKGHAAPALYAIWAAMGFIPAEELVNLRKIGSRLQGHPHVLDLLLAETSTGSLGQGFSAAIGMAFGNRLNQSNARVYALLGDGELQEGEVWEGAMFAAHHHMGNLCAIIDYNKLQSDDFNANIIGLEPLAAKWRAFGWHVIEIDGHDNVAILGALKQASTTAGRPTVIIAHTVKGKGVRFMENGPLWHGSVKLSREQTLEALTDLGVSAADMEDWIDGRVD
jgi:transketolase